VAPPHSLHDALLLHEATVLTNLPSQAVGVQNTCTLVPVVLELSSSQYMRWRELFLFALGKFVLEGHVLEDDPAWSSLGYTGSSSGTLSLDILALRAR